MQTLYGVLFAHSQIGWKRERWDTPDGDFIDVDRLPGAADAPLVVVFHGLEGGLGVHVHDDVLAVRFGRLGRCRPRAADRRVQALDGRPVLR